MKLKNILAKAILATNSQWLLRRYHKYHIPKYPSHHDILHQYQSRNTNLFFVQVGANSARLREPLHRYILLNNWRGIMVEPQSRVFAKLKTSFRRANRLVFEQFALSDQAGKVPFYFIEKAPDLPAWVDQLSSLNSEIPASVLERYPTANLIKEEVACIRLDELLTKNQVEQLDVLIIDAEGQDFAILRGLDWVKYQPDLVFFEHCHLSEKDYKSARNLLQSAGYALYEEGMNMAAIADINQYEAYRPLLFSKYH